MKRFVFPIMFSLGLVLGIGVTRAVAQPADAGIVADAGSASAPADSLHNPVDAPIASIDDARAAYKQGWALGVLAALVMVTAGLSRAVGKWPAAPVLSAVNKHKTVILIVGCLGAAAVAAYNALALGGSWMALLYAAGGAVLTFVSPKPNAVA